jgi:hypothetical protein
VRLEPTQPDDDRNASVAELAEAEHRLRVSRRRLELLRPLSEESNRITDEILRLYKLSDEEVLREVGLPRASLATIRELREKLETGHVWCEKLDEAARKAEARANAAEAELAKWRSGALRLATRSPTDDEHRKVDRGTEDEQRQAAGQAGGGFAPGEPRAVHDEMPKLDYSEAELLCLAKALISYRPRGLSQTELQNAAAKAGISLESAEQFVREWEATWPTIRQTKPPVGNCWCGAEQRCPTYYDCPASDEPAQPVQNSDENPSELDATAGPNVSGQLDLPFSDAAQQRQQIQAALRQGDQDIAANHGHDLGEVLADLDGKPSQVQLAPKPAT